RINEPASTDISYRLTRCGVVGHQRECSASDYSSLGRLAVHGHNVVNTNEGHEGSDIGASHIGRCREFGGICEISKVDDTVRKFDVQGCEPGRLRPGWRRPTAHTATGISGFHFLFIVFSLSTSVSKKALLAGEAHFSGDLRLNSERAVIYGLA